MSEATKSSGTVAVGCRYPHGLLLRLFKMSEQTEVMPGGRTQKTKVAEPLAQQVKLRGYSDPRIPVAVDSKGQYGVTRDVPADFWAEWLKQNAGSKIVKNQIVFSADNEHELDAKGKDFRKERNGLEPVDPDKPGERARGLKSIEKLKDENKAA